MKDNDELVDRLKQRGNIESEQVEEAFRETDRKVFVQEGYEDQAYEDRPLPIGEEETISAPHMVAINTELLEPEEGDRLVEVGSGSGYQIAILAQIADEVVGVEINEDLVKKSRERMEKLGLDNAKVYHGSGLNPVEGEFDGIIYSCAISPGRFEEAKEKLTQEGVLVAPVEQDHGQVVKKFKQGEESKHGMVRFVEFKD